MAKSKKQAAFVAEPVRPVVVMDLQVCVYQGELPDGAAYDPKTLLLTNGNGEQFRAEWFNKGGTQAVKDALAAVGLNAVMVRIPETSGPGVVLSDENIPEAVRKSKPKADKPAAAAVAAVPTAEVEESGEDEYDFSEFSDAELIEYAAEQNVTGFKLAKGGKLSPKGRSMLEKKITAALNAAE